MSPSRVGGGKDRARAGLCRADAFSMAAFGRPGKHPSPPPRLVLSPPSARPGDTRTPDAPPAPPLKHH